MALSCTSAFTTKAPSLVQSRGHATGRVSLPLSPVCSLRRAEQSHAHSEVSCRIALLAICQVQESMLSALACLGSSLSGIKL